MSAPISQPYVDHPQFGPVQPTNTKAILSLVFAFIFWPLSIVFGHMARKQIRQSNESGAGLALAGLIISYVCLGFFVLVMLLLVIGLAATA